MAINRFSGRKKLILNLGISIIIAFLMHLVLDAKNSNVAEIIGEFSGRTLGIFFLFFIWSWKNKHVLRDKLVSVFLHSICILVLSIMAFLFWMLIISSTGNFPTLIMILAWGIGIAIKYKRLFWPKNRFNDDLYSKAEVSEK